MAESFLCLMFLCSLVYGWQGKLLQFWWGLLCHCGQWLLLCCSKGLSGSSLVALGIGVPQSLQYAGDTSPDVACRLVSHCGSLSTHYLRPGALSTCTVLGFLSSCDVVAPSSCCSHYCSCTVQRTTLLLWCAFQSSLFTYFFNLFLFIYISWRLITLQYCSGFGHTLT